MNNEAFKLLDQVRTQLGYVEAYPLNGTATLIHILNDLIRTIEILANTQKLLITTEVEKLQLKNGDALVVKLGDRNVGWIPGPDDQQRAEKLFNALMKELKLDVPVLVYHYGVELQTIQRDL
jgi:hypothetical protein